MDILFTILKGIGLLVCLYIFILIIRVRDSLKKRKQEQALMVKSDEKLLGKRFIIPREGKEGVRVNLHIPTQRKSGVLVLNLHGGAFVGGNADTLDSQSERIANDWGVMVANVNYTLVSNGVNRQYAEDEVVDCVKFFINNANEYQIDPSQIVLLGYSAGASHAMCAAIKLKKEGIDVGAQILCYAFANDGLPLYEQLSEEEKQSMAPAFFIMADNDPITDDSLLYEEALREHQVKTKVKIYFDSIHGYIEENNPEYEKLSNVEAKSKEQEVMARQAETEMKNWINEIFGI